jgi:hypothetical protein
MKQTISILLLFLLIGCSENNNSRNQMTQNYGKQLYEHGFLKYADTLKTDSLRSALIDSFDIYDEGNNKIALIDAEELAEFNLDFFMPDLHRILEKRKFTLNVATANDCQSTNEILINDKRIKLYTKTEMDIEDPQEAAPRNFFREVNRQLKASKMDESFYLLYGGNDLHVLLLTEDQFKIIAEKYKNNIKETPYTP